MSGWWVTSTWRLMVLHLRLVLKDECSRVIFSYQFSVYPSTMKTWQYFLLSLLLVALFSPSRVVTVK